MNIQTAIRKIKTLTNAELNKTVALCDIDITNYKHTIENYPPRRMEKNGIPFLNRLKRQKQLFLDELSRRES